VEKKVGEVREVSVAAECAVSVMMNDCALSMSIVVMRAGGIAVTSVEAVGQTM